MNELSENMLSFQHISKSFPGVKALRDVSFSIRKGEVHALVGENGAGKSTLLNILKGIYQPDEGQIIYDGSSIKIKSPGHASSIGINMVHQEINLVPELTVGQNILLGNEPMGKGIAINYRELYKRCNEALKELDCRFSDKEQVKKLSAAQMQMIAIARSLMYNSKVVAFDEPTASLSNAETRHLFEIINKLKNNGTSIIYVSHRLEEIFEIADRVTVLRDGKVIDTLNVKDVDKKTLVRLMVGREVSEYMQHTANYSTEEVALKVENVGYNFTQKKTRTMAYLAPKIFADQGFPTDTVGQYNIFNAKGGKKFESFAKFPGTNYVGNIGDLGAWPIDGPTSRQYPQMFHYVPENKKLLVINGQTDPVLMKFIVSNDFINVAEIIIPTGGTGARMTEPCCHEGDATFYVDKGTLSVYILDTRESFQIRDREALFVPKGMTYQLFNYENEPLRVLFSAVKL